MDRNKLSLIVAGVAALALVLGGWFVGVQPQLAAASASTQQRADIDSRNDTVRAEIARLENQYADIATLKSHLADLSASIPESTDTTPFIKDLDRLAIANGVTISSLTFGDAQTYVPPAAPAAAPGSDGAAAAPSPSASAEPTAGASTAVTAPDVVTDPAITSANFILIPVSVTVAGTDTEALAFTAGVQEGARLFLVNSIGTAAGQGETVGDGAGASAGTDMAAGTAPSGARDWTLSGYIFVLRSTDGAPSATPAQG